MLPHNKLAPPSSDGEDSSEDGGNDSNGISIPERYANSVDFPDIIPLTMLIYNQEPTNVQFQVVSYILEQVSGDLKRIPSLLQDGRINALLEEIAHEIPDSKMKVRNVARLVQVINYFQAGNSVIPSSLEDWVNATSTYDTIYNPSELKPLHPFNSAYTFSGLPDDFRSFSMWLHSELQPHKAVMLLSNNRDSYGQVITVEVTHPLKRTDTLLRTLITSAITNCKLLNGNLRSSPQTTGRELWVQILNKYDTIIMRSNQIHLILRSLEHLQFLAGDSFQDFNSMFQTRVQQLQELGEPLSASREYVLFFRAIKDPGATVMLQGHLTKEHTKANQLSLITQLSALEVHLNTTAPATPSALPPTVSAGARYTSQVPTTTLTSRKDRIVNKHNNIKKPIWSDTVKRHWAYIRDEFEKRAVNSQTGELLKGISLDPEIYGRTFMTQSPSSAHAIQAQTTSTMVPYTTNSYSAKVNGTSNSAIPDPHTAFNEYRDSLGLAYQP